MSSAHGMEGVGFSSPSPAQLLIECNFSTVVVSRECAVALLGFWLQSGRSTRLMSLRKERVGVRGRGAFSRFFSQVINSQLNFSCKLRFSRGIG